MITIMKRYTNDIGHAKKDLLAKSLAWGGLYSTPKWKHSPRDCRLLILEFLARHMDLPKFDSIFPSGSCAPFTASYRNVYKLRPICNYTRFTERSPIDALRTLIRSSKRMQKIRNMVIGKNSYLRQALFATIENAALINK
jgi:hypothetical protein